jgi:hypothetical protein
MNKVRDGTNIDDSPNDEIFPDTMKLAAFHGCRGDGEFVCSLLFPVAPNATQNVPVAQNATQNVSVAPNAAQNAQVGAINRCRDTVRV